LKASLSSVRSARIPCFMLDKPPSTWASGCGRLEAMRRQPDLGEGLPQEGLQWASPFLPCLDREVDGRANLPCAPNPTVRESSCAAVYLPLIILGTPPSRRGNPYPPTSWILAMTGVRRAGFHVSVKVRSATRSLPPGTEGRRSPATGKPVWRAS
jgi:hypothetical protein